ncbi:MAG: Type 1 glutamine amidotransferase-like domain-containing protein [Sulfurimonas sp.]|jgi:peptidase E
MKGHILLIGGGEIFKKETSVIDDAIKILALKGSSLVFFPTAAGDSQGYIDTIVDTFGDTFEVIGVIEEKGKKFAEDALLSASVIYLGGGKTELLLDLFERWNLVPLLYKALERGGIISGMSAGAQALSDEYVDYDEHNMEVKKGWGLVPIFCMVHSQQTSAKKAKDVYESVDDNLKNTFVAIGENAAWQIDALGERKIGIGNAWVLDGIGLDRKLVML